MLVRLAVVVALGLTPAPIADLGAFKELDYVFFVIGFFLLIYWAIDLYGHTYASFTSLDSINLLLIII
ncbi:hypothetical protein F4824DRAFT_500191 [Ustulina deusta]|nr:hypothetical protein F4824DRAFT_500191 [Ustulina deusta]